MNRHVNALCGRLSLRPPQRHSLEILDRICELVPPHKDVDLSVALEAIRAEFPSLSDFEREFPSLCFALATGVGKTRLMGAFIAYLHLQHGLNNFFVLAPNLTIYNKLIGDFSPGNEKYVFKGIAEFALDAPRIITGENYDKAISLFDAQYRCNINIFNIAKINGEMRGGKAPRIKRLSEYIGQSYFDYLAALPDLVLLMDESHRYRASAGVRALNELNPVLGLELTATPYVETARGAVPFRNVVLDYSLSKAMEDGFVKEPAVVTRRDFNPLALTPDELETIKLEDGIRLHESLKVDLETFARETGQKFVKPFVLVIARDVTHATQLMNRFASPYFLDGRYAERVIQVDSSKTGSEEEAMIERLLRVEDADEPTEIVIHVNMLKEGWDVTNLYTIIPLRAANAKTLVEQSIGRGLRLPYGRRTGVTAVDRLNIVAHDRFQEIVDEANRPGSAIRLQTVFLDADGIPASTSLLSLPSIEEKLGLAPAPAEEEGAETPASAPKTAFVSPQEQHVAQTAYRVMTRLARQPALVPGSAALSRPEVQKQIVAEVKSQLSPQQLEIEGTSSSLDVSAIVEKTAQLVEQNTIDIPRIVLTPKEQVRFGFVPFTPDLQTLRLVPPSEDLYIKFLRTGKEEIQHFAGIVEEKRPEDYIVSGLVDFDDVSYDDHADLLYELAGQTVEHFRSYLSEEETHRVLRMYGRNIARFLHTQMQDHIWEEAVEYEAKVSAGFSPLKPSAYTAPTNGAPLDFRQQPADRSNMSRFVFGGFEKCLYPLQKFDSDAERKMALILERDAAKWFRPARGQFQIFYRVGRDPVEYQPDFVAETGSSIFLIEVKRASDLSDAEVIAKSDAALAWCERASHYAQTSGGKPWRYLLVPHDAIADNLSLAGMAQGYSARHSVPSK